MILAALALIAAQPAGAPQPLVVSLCNDTPARAAFAVVRRTTPRARVQRGWFSVEAGACLEGAIGTSLGGTALVHAYSGSYRWPADGGEETLCTPGRSHDAFPAAPPCAEDAREAGFMSVETDVLPGRYRLEHRISCADLAPEEAELCALGRRDADGFAELVRVVEVCNAADAGATAVAVAGETAEADGWRVEGWRGVTPGACEPVWRGLSAGGVVYVHTAGLGEAVRTEAFQTFCVDPETAFTRRAEAPGETACADGLRAAPFRPLRFDEGVSRLSLDLEMATP